MPLAISRSGTGGFVKYYCSFSTVIQHIGDVFIVVQKAYWNQGLGQILLEEGLEWAHSTGLLRKLVLNVQVRNERAVHLYKS